MEIRRILVKILAIVCIVALVLPSFSTVLATTFDKVLLESLNLEQIGQIGETARFGISLLNKNGWGYKIQDRLTYRIYETNGSNGKDYSRNIYCLDYTKRFPGENSNNNTFTNMGNLTGANKEKLELIAENMYLTNMSEEEKDILLSKIFKNIIDKTASDANPVTLEFIKRTITEDDIIFAQSCAIWKYTNNLTWQGSAIWLTNKENPSSTDWYQISNVGEARFALMQEVYNYLTSSSLISESKITNPSLIKTTKTGTEVDDGYIVGPFQVKTGTNTDFKLKLTDQTGAELTNYRLVDKNGNRLSTTLERTLDKEFYVKLPLKHTATKVILELEYNTYKTTKSLWQNGENGTQPLLEVTREKIPGSDRDEAEINRPEKIHDLALRKYIVKVGDTNITDRTPVISYNKADKEINYKHKKDPVVLKAGDTVIYNITVYNEGNQKATATRVKDYLPEGLEFVRNSTINKQYGWISAQNGTYVVTGYTKNYTLDPFDENSGNLSSVTLQVECRVKETVQSGILTNVAEIIDDDIDDIDSVPGSIDITKIDLPNYKGRNTNKADLTDKNYFYRGQEDDDDFEKVTVEPPVIKEEQFDLALRKYITTVNGENKNREPKVNVTPLVNKTSTTAIYTHSKEPVTVKKGDIVIYSIRVYNEGDIDGYANEITDYLPEGLGFLVNHQINNENGWTVATGETPQVIKLNTIENAIQNVSQEDFTNITSLDNVDVIKGKVSIKSNKLQYKAGSTENLIKAFDPSKTELDSKVLQVACIVLSDEITQKTIKNIAAVTSEKDKDGNDIKDRDSNPNEINPNTYPENSNIQDDDDFEKIILEEIPETEIDLSLRKYITTVNGENKNREPKVDITPLVNKTSTTAIYTHSKEPVTVKKGDVVIYSIRVYNEGDVDGYANEITDYLPEGLGFLVNHQINYSNSWKVAEGEQPQIIKLNTIENANKNLSQADFVDVSSLDNVDVIKGKVSIKSNKLQYKEGNTENLIKAFDPSKTELDSKVLQVACIVIDDELTEKTIKNIAAITSEKDKDGKNAKDRDSEPNEINTNTYPEDTNIQDDDDYEKLILVNKKYDLALKKFLTSVQGEEITPSRLEKVDVAPLLNDEKDAKYTMNKDAVKVRKGNNVVYTIRVYNEGEVDSYVEEIRDNLPEGLEFIENSDINKEYRWKKVGNELRTDYLSKQVNPDKIIKAFNKETREISYQEVKIEFKVVSTDVKMITNIAEITEDDSDDRDSTPDNNKPEEDDQDYENIIPGIYDLALQKFITKLNDKDITSRIPMITIDKNGKITYNHTNEPLTVVNQSVIIYCIRVYNEGTVEGYAEEIKDNIPEGLIYLPEHEVNKKYNWKLYNENGEQVEKVEDAKQIRTTYLSKQESEARGEDNKLKPFDKSVGLSDENPDYRDVQVAFKVDQAKLGATNSKIKNIAEISKDDDDDNDSIPDNDDPNEDDQDDEEIVLKYFDLSLLKYVTKVVVNEDGVVKEISTGHTGLENPEPTVKVEINKKKFNKTSVTFIYTIKVTNEGEIEGYAKEIKDRLPAGLEFYEEDNPDWKIDSEGIVTTDKLANTLLKPGESATVEIALRWKRDEQNLGMKVNTAEISKDQNEYNTPDIDSTPDNNKDGEDDQDTATVVLSTSTGSAETYIVFTIAIMTLMATGIYSIKKFVL